MKHHARHNTRPRTVWTDDSLQAGTVTYLAGQTHSVIPLFTQDTLKSTLDNRGSLKRIVGDVCFQIPPQASSANQIAEGLVDIGIAEIQVTDADAALSTTSPDPGTAGDLDYPWLWRRSFNVGSLWSEMWDNSRVLPAGSFVDINVHRVVKPEHSLALIVRSEILIVAAGSMSTGMTLDYTFRLLWGAT